MNAGSVRQAAAAPAAAPQRTPLRRTCACGAHTPMGGECDSCKNKKVQAKFAVGTPGDAFEREADAVADQVMSRLPVGTTTRAPVAVQRYADRSTDGADAPASVDRALADGGAPLESGLRTDMEARFGHDFSHVRTHTDAAAERSAHEIDAAAYTAGQHVVFGHGRYAPATSAGRRLIAHELTHVLQQTPGVVRRTPKVPAAPKASSAPKLVSMPAKNTPPCACLVFIHHDEANARLIAQSLYDSCKYNLAMVKPEGYVRLIKLPAHEKREDPNGLFPPNVINECWNDDKRCTDEMAKNESATGAAAVKDYVERQFFMAIKGCSNGFTLPIVGLHNNSIDDTASYRGDLAAMDTAASAAAASPTPVPAKPTDLPKLADIEGKTFDKGLAARDPKKPDTLPFAEFKAWVGKLSGVKVPATGKTTGGPFKSNKTNIFIWCNAGDNTKCHIGDPRRPDNVVWVTNEADFDTLSRTKVNVVLQTNITPGGDSDTDLSSLFVTLSKVVETHYGTLDAASKVVIDTKIALLPALYQQLGALMFAQQYAEFLKVSDAIRAVTTEITNLVIVQQSNVAERALKDKQRRFVNIETPPKELIDETGLVQSLADVRSTLAAVGLDCCASTPAPGETESQAAKAEKAVRAGALKPRPKPKAKP